MAVVAFLYAHRSPPKPPHPLAISAAEVTAATIDGASLAAGSPGFAVAAALPSRLAALPPLATPVSWAGPQTLRLTLRDGTTLWLQLMREGADVFVRVNADLPAARSRAIRNLRLKAWRLPGDSLGAIPGFDGNSAASAETNKLIHKNKRGKVN